MTLKDYLAQLEREFILNTLDNNDSNLAKTARQLGLGRSVLYRKMQRLGIKRGYYADQKDPGPSID